MQGFKAGLVAVTALSLLAACGGAPHEHLDHMSSGAYLDAATRQGMINEVLKRGQKKSGAFLAYPDPYLNGTPNPAAGAVGTVRWAPLSRGGTGVLVEVAGVAANRRFGSHVHIGACSVNQAGGHYQNVVAPAPELVADPAYANPENEVWLDFTTNKSGKASAFAYVTWTFRPDGANSVMIHDRHTDVNGRAGPKLACLDVDF